MKADVLVVGGGLGGALVAQALRRRGVDVVVADAGSEPGGVAATIRHRGYLLEPAAGTVMHPHPHLAPLLRDLPIRLHPAQGSGTRYVHHRGRTVALSQGPGIVTTPLVGLVGKARALAELAASEGDDPDESLDAFLRRRLGRDAGRLAAWLAASGVHAGDPSALSTAAAFPSLTAAERSHGSLLRAMLASRRGDGPRPTVHVVEGGTARIADAVAAVLGERWLRSWRVDRVDQGPSGWRAVGPAGGEVEADRVVLAVPSWEIGRLMGGEVADELTRLQAAPVAVVWLGLLDHMLPEGMGALVGPDDDLATLGFLYESSYAPERAPSGRGLVKAIVGGATRPHHVDMADPELTARVVGELEAVVGADVDVETTYVTRHVPGIPQYTADRRSSIVRVAQLLPPGIDVAGWHVDGVGISRLATAAATLAERIDWEQAAPTRSEDFRPS